MRQLIRWARAAWLWLNESHDWHDPAEGDRYQRRHDAWTSLHGPF